MLTTSTSTIDQRLLARRIAVLAFTVALAVTGVAATAGQAHAAGGGDNPTSVRWR